MVSKEFLAQHFQGQVTPIDEINGVSEQQFALLLQRKFPGLTLVYQHTTFTWRDTTGKTRRTVPDFLFINPNSGSMVLIEITMLPNNGADPKREQKEVMSNGNPNIKYVVLYRDNLESIQKKNPHLSFFNGRKVKKE